MKNKLFVLAFCWLFSLNAICQVEHTCEVSQMGNIMIPKEKILANIPDESTTMKYVKVNFHFMMKTDSTLNFRPHDDGLGDCSFTAYDFSKIVIDYVNLRLAANQQMHLPPGNNTPVLERKYRLILKDIYFHYDDNAYTFNNLSNPEISFYSINPTSEINIFFVYDDTPGYTGGGLAVFSGNRYVKIKASWQKYRDYGTVGLWAEAWVIIHETGHNFGLLHTMHNNSGVCCDTCDDDCSDTPTILDILNLGYPYPCPSWGNESSQYSNNAMDYSGLIAITPEQLGIVHYTLTNDMVNYLEINNFTTFPESIIEENQNVIWQNDTIMKTSLRIKSGASLTIKDCCVHMYKTAQIIVEPRGSLILDGTIITNNCGTMWPGIQVWGDSNTHQYLVNGSYEQGYLELKNGATIKNAICAVELCQPGVTGTSGGIIKADSAFFINNAKAVRMKDYTNHYPTTGLEAPCQSHFYNCVFSIDSTYLGTETFCEHVEITRVKNIKFEGCSFSALPNIMGVSSSCYGIAAEDASFSVNAYCKKCGQDPPVSPCPEECLAFSSFSGFNNAVHAIHNGNSVHSFVIKNSVFSNNDIGIYALNIGYAVVVGNSFSVGRSSECAFGVYAEGVVDFFIEDNDFFPSHGFTDDSYGIGVFNCPGPNDIYLNYFEGLTCSNLSVGLNTTKTQGFFETSVQGLTYTCNQNILNTIDFCVLNDNGYGNINPQQGTTINPAANTFSGSSYHFYNEGDSIVSYYYDTSATGQTPLPSLLHRVNRISTTGSNSCRSHYGSIIKSQSEKAKLEKEYQIASEKIYFLIDLYKQQSYSGATEPELAELRAQIGQYVHERSLAAGDIVRSNLNDSITNLPELRTWLQNAGDIASDRIAIASYIQEGDFYNATELANTLPSLYGLDDVELADYEDYLRLLELYKILHESGRTTSQLSEEELRLVEDIADNPTIVSRLLAKALLECFSGEKGQRHPCPVLPNRIDKGRSILDDEESNVTEITVFVIPNPATGQTVVEYSLPENSSCAELCLFNIFGVKKLDLNITKQHGSKVINLNGLPNGVYFLLVTDQEGRKCVRKVVKH